MGVRGALAHFGQDTPAAGAFRPRCLGKNDSGAGHVVELEGAGRGRGGGYCGAGRDGDFGEVEVLEQVRVLRVCNVKGWRGLETRTDCLVAAGDFERAGDDAAEVAEARFPPLSP